MSNGDYSFIIYGTLAECGAREMDSYNEYSDAVDASEPAQYDKGCDEYPDFVCHPCGKSGKEVVATKFCVNCANLMCSTCLDEHYNFINKFDVVRGHQITTAEASTKYQSQVWKSEPSIRCIKHNGKLIDMYCQTHETPGCANCISIEHSSCATKEYTPIKAEFETDYTIKSSVDTRVSCITDTCLLDDGTLILADLNNRVIKKLSATFQLEDTLKIPGKPGAICQTKYPEVAIPLLNDRTVQFATVLPPMSLTRSISIEEACRGIAFHNSALYLSCGGMQAQYRDGPGEIRVYDQNDDLCRKYTKVCAKKMSIPKRIVATSSDIFFADSDNGVFGLGVHGGGEKGPFTHNDMVSPIGLCGLTHGVLIVCGYESHNVMLLDVQDGSMKSLIAKDKGLKKPKSVCLVPQTTDKKLLVTMDSADYVKVFNLIQK